MEFFNNVKNKVNSYLAERKSRTLGVILRYYHGMTQWIKENQKLYVDEGYKKNVYVYAAINAIARSTSSVSWDLYQKPMNPNDDLKKIYNSDIMKLFERPNPFESRRTFLYNIIAHLHIYGNAYIEEVSPRGKVPKELYLLRPDRITIKPAMVPGKGTVKSYIYNFNGEEKPISSDKILHLKLFDPDDDFFGMSPIQAAGMSVDQNNLSKSWNIDILNNGGMPNGSLSTNESLTEDQFESVEAQMKEYSNTKRGQVLILQGGLKYERFSMTAEDMGFVNATKMSAREISIAFGVPPEILGDSTNKTYNNYTQARKAFYEETILPLLELLEQELGHWLLEKFGYDPNLMLFTYNKEDIEAIQEDINVKWEKANNSYFLTLNEKRNLVGYEDIEGGEVFMVPNTFTTVTDLKDLEENQQQEIQPMAQIDEQGGEE